MSFLITMIICLLIRISKPQRIKTINLYKFYYVFQITTKDGKKKTFIQKTHIHK